MTKMAKTVTNILELSSTQFVSNIRLQHPSPTSVTNIDVAFIEWHINYLIHLIFFNNLEWRGYFDILTVMYFFVFLIESRSSWLGVSWRFDLRKIRSGQIFFVIIHSNLVSKILKSRKSEKSHPNPFLSVRVLFWYNRPDGTEWTISSVIKLIPPIIQSMIVLYYE